MCNADVQLEHLEFELFGLKVRHGMDPMDRVPIFTAVERLALSNQPGISDGLLKEILSEPRETVRPVQLFQSTRGGRPLHVEAWLCELGFVNWPPGRHDPVPRPCDLGAEDRVHARDSAGSCKSRWSNPRLDVTRQSHMVLAGWSRYVHRYGDPISQSLREASAVQS